MNNNQGKTPKQNKDSHNFTLLGYVGIVIATLLIILKVGEYSGCNKEIQEGIQNDPRPTNHISNYLPPSFYLELDTLNNNLDSLDKRLDSLIMVERIVDSILESKDSVVYGVYGKWNTDLDMDCGDDPIIDSSLLDCGYSDEYRMWITGEGDTIWE